MTQFLVTGLLAILVTSIYAQESIEIELEGKFVSKSRNILQEVDFKTSANVEKHNEKREIMLSDPPVVFNGLLTIRTFREVRVIGVNVSFLVTEINLSEDLDVTRAKREETSKKKFRVGLRFQFRVGEIDSQSLGIKLNLNVNQIKHVYTPATSYDNKPRISAGASRETFKFTGKVRPTDENKRWFLIFAVKAGLTPKVSVLPEHQDVDERGKRGAEDQNAEIKLDGELTYDYRDYYGDPVTEVFRVTAELFTFDQLRPADESTRRKEFFSRLPSDSPDVEKILLETGGNVTVSENQRNLFQASVYSGTHLTANSTSGWGNRMSSTTSNEVFDIKYNGFLTETWSSHPGNYNQSVSVNFSWWEISRTIN